MHLPTPLRSEIVSNLLTTLQFYGPTTSHSQVPDQQGKEPTQKHPTPPKQTPCGHERVISRQRYSWLSRRPGEASRLRGAWTPRRQLGVVHNFIYEGQAKRLTRLYSHRLTASLLPAECLSGAEPAAVPTLPASGEVPHHSEPNQALGCLVGA